MEFINPEPKWKKLLKKNIYKHIPFTYWIQRYTRSDVFCDFVAGITISLTMIPQSIAYAALADLAPQYGLNSAFMGCFVYVFFGTVKEVVIGPSSLMALLTYEYTHDMSPDFVILLCFLTGIVEFIMGILRLGLLVELIAVPVVSGFTSATSIIILVSQIKGLLGIHFKSLGFVDNVKQIFLHLSETKLADTVLGVFCIIGLLLFKFLNDVSIPEKVPGRDYLKKFLWFLSIGRNALVVIFTSWITLYFEAHDTQPPFQITRAVESGIPNFEFPPTTTVIGNRTYTFPEMVRELGNGYFIIPVVSVLANVAIAKAFTSGSVDATQEMITLSLCNIAGSFVSSMPTCGAFTRSVVISASGVRTPLAGLYSAALTLLALSYLTPHFHLIPRATLAAVLITAVVFLIDYKILLPLWRTCKQDFFILVFTFVCCLTFGVEMGLLFGILIGISILIYRWARPEVNVEEKEGIGGDYINIEPKIGMFFPAVTHLFNLVMKTAAKKGHGKKPIVINCAHLTGTDFSTARSLAFMAKTFEKRGQRLIFINVPNKFIRMWKEAGCKDSHFGTSEGIEYLLFGSELNNCGEKEVSIATCEEEEKIELKEVDCFIGNSGKREKI